jgi:hypothetical protein
MAENGGQFLGLRPTSPGGPFGYPGAAFGNAGTILFLRPSNVEEVVASTRREILYVTLRPCFAVPEAAEEGRVSSGNILYLRPSNVEEVVASTRREVCYVGFRPCFGVPETAEEERMHAGNILFLRPSVSGFVRALDSPLRSSGAMLFLRPAVQPETPEYEWHGKVGYYSG